MVNNKQKKQNWTVWAVVVCVFVVIAVAVFLVLNVVFDKKKNNNTSEQLPTKVEEKKDNTVKEPKPKEESSEKPKVVQYDGDDPNEAEELSGVITYAGKVGDNLTIRVNIDQFVEGGMCYLTIMQEENVIFGASTNIIENASTATCDGYDIPLDGFPTGLMEIIIDLDDGQKTGVLKGEVEI